MDHLFQVKQVHRDLLPIEFINEFKKQIDLTAKMIDQFERDDNSDDIEFIKKTKKHIDLSSKIYKEYKNYYTTTNDKNAALNKLIQALDQMDHFLK